MKIPRLASALVAAGLAVGAFGITSAASAHTPKVSASCSGVSVSLTNYQASKSKSKVNTVKVVVGGKIVADTTFQTSYDQTFDVPQDGATTTWSVDVTAWDDKKYDVHDADKVGPCGTPPYTPHTVTCVWELHGASTPDKPFAEPQTFVNCDGSVPTGTCATYQRDVYKINSKNDEAILAKLKDAGVLHSGDDSAIFSSADFPKDDSGCTPPDQTVPVPVKPVASSPDCDTDGSVTIPANTDAVKWLVGGEQVNGGSGDDLGPGAYLVSAHTTYGHVFADGTHSVQYEITVEAKTGKCNTTPPVTPPTSTTPVPHPSTSTPALPTSTKPSTASTSPSSGIAPPVSTHRAPPVTVNRVVPASRKGPLAGTGVTTGALIAVAALLVGTGAIVFVAGRRPRRRMH